MTGGFDKMSVNQELLMSLPFREGVGAITQDYAKPLREVDLINAPAWTTIASGLGVLAFDGGVSNQYLECDTLETVDLNFTTGDYSIFGWVNWTDTALSEIIIARYELDVDGWELYFWNSVLQLRHHHAGGATDRTGCHSWNWTPGTWWLLGISRSGAYPLMYRNGVPLTMGYSVGGMLDPATCDQDLVIGTRFCKTADWYSGMMWNVRVAGRALSARDHMNIYQLEKHWFS